VLVRLSVDNGRPDRKAPIETESLK